MNTWLVVGLIAIAAYVIQIMFALRQIKHFNQVYQALRRQGRVAIGRRPGRIQSGTIIMFAIDTNGVILTTQKMQGISVASRFKHLTQFDGIELQALTPYHPLVSKELKMTRQTIENARELYLRIQSGDFHEETKLSPFDHAKLYFNVAKHQLLHK